MAKKKKIAKKEKDERYGLMIPAGLLVGMGLGFLLGNLPAYLFMGLGVGFLLAAIVKKK